MIVELAHILLVSVLLFIIGLSGILFNFRNIVVVIIGLQLMFLAAILNFIAFGCYVGNAMGPLFALVGFGVGVAELVTVLPLLVVHFRAHGRVSIDSMTELRG